MIDSERCKDCPVVRPLLAGGLGEKAINAIAAASTCGAETQCRRGPESMPGGWMKCHTVPVAKAALLGAAVLLEARAGQPQMSLATV